MLTPFTPEEARVHTDRMRQYLDASWQMFIEAYQRRADVGLGYPSWAAYCNNELGEIRPNLPVAMRREAVTEMTEAQMPTRAQAAVLGTTHTTIVRDQQAVGTNVPSQRTVVTSNGSVRPVPSRPETRDVPVVHEDELTSTRELEAFAAEVEEFAAEVGEMADEIEDDDTICPHCGGTGRVVDRPTLRVVR